MHKILFFFSTLLIVSLSHSTMILDRVIVNFEAGASSREDIVIHNPDSDPMYIKVVIMEVLNPGTDLEERRVIEDPKEINFLATPAKLIIPAGGRKQVRLVNIGGHGATERVFRVNLIPVEPPDLAPAESMNLKLKIAYQVLVFIEPLKSYPDLVGVRDGKLLTLTNEGNANVLIRNGEQCPTAPQLELKCLEYTGNRLYPGNSTTIELPFDQPVSLSLTMGNKNKTVLYE